jgi:hypothetical protein
MMSRSMLVTRIFQIGGTPYKTGINLARNTRDKLSSPKFCVRTETLLTSLIYIPFYLIEHSSWWLGMTSFANRNLPISSQHNRLVVLILSLIHPATTNPYQWKVNIPNMMGLLYP